jgi:hypothetical protein
MMRRVTSLVAWATLTLLAAGCASVQPGPDRSNPIEADIAYTRPLAELDLTYFLQQHPQNQASIRNQIVTARMYQADIAYNYYEARLTNEIQKEGLLATATSLGLTTSATLLTPPGTKTILSGLATTVTGLDKAYNEKVLLANTMQALQTQMRADRKTRAAAIFAKMLRNVGNTKVPTPIAEYTLPMALSDADAYYQAGTIASALIGLSKTVANAEQNADAAKGEAGPNPGAVANVKDIAAPLNVGNGTRPSVTAPVVRTRVTFSADEATTALRRWLDPQGTGVRDEKREQRLLAFINKTLNLNLRRLALFLTADQHAANRAVIASQLDKIP